MKKSSKSLKLGNISYGSLKRDFPENDNYISACNDRENILQNLSNRTDVDANELKSIQDQLLTLVLEVNKRPKLKIWQELNEELNNISHFSKILLLNKNLESQLHVVYNYLLENPEYSYLLPDMETKLKHFLSIPNKTLAKSKVKGPYESEKYFPLPVKKLKKKPNSKIMPDNVVEWFVDPIKGDLFNPSTIDRNITVKPKKIRIKDFLAAIGSVAQEIIFTQYAFEKPLENLIKAFHIDLTEFKHGNLSELDDEYSETETEEVEIEQEVEENFSNLDVKNVDLAKGLPKPKSGREAVIYMIKCFHLREMRMAYLNYTNLRIRDLYSLTVVKKSKLDPEHYIFSSFGIIHRQSDGSAIAMSLTDWYRESILYNALRCIPLFKNFLIYKYFQGWRTITIRKQNLAVGKFLTNNLLTANITYGKSILQILRLLDEISQITFVPKELLEIQTEASFIKSFTVISVTANEYLMKFYKYIQLMANETAAELYKALQFSQAQLHSNNLYSNDSIYMKKLKQKSRQTALNDCLRQVYKLGDFVKLINYMLNSKIVEITLSNISILGELMCSMEIDSGNLKANKEAIFHTKVIITNFNDSLSLQASPAVEDIETMFIDIVNRIPRLILKHCYPLDGLIKSDYLNRFEDILTHAVEENKPTYSTILTSKSEIKTSIMNQSNNSIIEAFLPNLPYIKLPKKSDDNLRVATPPAVNPNIFGSPSLKLIGRSIPAKFTPISSEDVFEILKMNPAYHNLMNGFTELFHQCKIEMNKLFVDYNWLIDVRNEYIHWSKIDMNTEWINQSTYLFEQKLIKLKNLIQTLESTEKKVPLSNKIFLVSFESILEELLSEMEFELDSISTFILNFVRQLGLEFIDKISVVLKVLRVKDVDFELFTNMIFYIGYGRDNHAEFQKSVDYIKSLFDILRMAGKPINDEDKSIEDEVTSLWESFMFLLQEANDFVNNEKQNVLFGIKSRIQVLEKAARRVEDDIRSDKYSFVSEDLEDVLKQISDILEEVDQINKELNSLFNCYQSLANEECVKNVDLVHIRSVVNLTYSNWMLLYNSKQQIENWKSLLFSKFQVKLASETICQWQNQLLKFIEDPNSKISVVQQIQESVNEFSSFMPFFHQMSSPMFLLAHWQQFFLEIGHDFVDPYEKLTVQNLMDIDIRMHSRVLDILYNDATMKNKANMEFNNYMRYWLTREFEFEEHIPDFFYQRSNDELFQSISISKTPENNRERSELEKYHEMKKMESRIEKSNQLPITKNDGNEIYLVSELDKLHEDITDTVISIQSRKTLDKSDNRYELLVNALEELRSLILILSECQEKWLFLERIFEEEYFVQTHMSSANAFLSINKEFLKLSNEIRLSPIVLHHVVFGQILLSEKDNEKPLLKSILLQLIEQMMAINIEIQEILNNARNLYPRLYFLQDYQLIKLLNCQVSQNIKKINQFIPLCFPAIENVIFVNSAESINKIRAISVVSKTNEKLDLFRPLIAMNAASQWLKEFELSFKTTLKFYIDSCVIQRLKESDFVGSGTFITERTKSSVFKEIDNIGEITQRMSEENKEKVEEIINDIFLSYEVWLSKYPLQVLLLTEKIFFTKQLNEAIINSPIEIKLHRSSLIMKKSNYAKLINKTVEMDDPSQIQTKNAIQNLMVLNDRHIEILTKLEEDSECGPRSFIYQSIIKYNLNEGYTKMSLARSEEVCGNVTMDCLNTQFIYDYEYVPIDRCDLYLTSVTDQVIVNMLIGLHNFEMATIISSAASKLETIKSISEILGRNLFIFRSNKDIYSELVHKYFLGALMSGSLLFIDNIDKMAAYNLSDISKNMWVLKLLLAQKDYFNNKQKISRRSSSPCKLFKEDYDELLNTEKHEASASQREPRPSTHYERYHEGYYDMQSSKLNKGKNWPFFPNSFENMIPNDYEPYIPNFLFQANLFDQTIDVRYGFGLCGSVSERNNDLISIPLSLKSQMRICSFVEIDEKFVIKSFIIMAGQERNLEILETCIKSLLDEINHFQPHLFRAVCKLIPEVISKANWLKELPVNALRHSFISEIALRISNTMKDRDIFLMSINKCFPCDISDDNPQYDPGFLHQIKCQIRMKNREVLSSDIDKLMELKKCINSHNITVIYGPTCSGKTTAIDILVKSINSYVSSSQTPRFETKNRGTIDVLKTLSNERKSQFPLEIQFGKEDFRRILLKKINLANFTDLELNNQRLINGNKLPNALSSIIDPLVKLQKFDKFQIWICVETDEENVNKDISALASYLEDSVKLIFEVVTYKPLKDVELQNYHGIVHFPSLSNINYIILEQHLKSLLTRKVITYYGCKYLLKVALQMFTDLCKSFKLYLEISQHAGLDIYFVKQSLDILEILLLENQDLFIDQESINSLEDRFNTFLSFSIIQGSRGVLYTILIEKRIMSHEEYEQILRNSLGILCSEIADMKHEYYSSSLFGLTIDMDEICLKPFSIVKGCHLSSFDSCADGVAKYLLTLLMKYSKSIYLNGPDNRIDSFTNLLRFNKRLHLNDSSVFSLMRQSLYDNKKPFWDILSNEDPLFNISESRNIILLENFLNDSNFFNKIHSLLQFSLEHGLIYDLNDNLTFFNEISLDRLILIVTNNNESYNLFNMEDPKWCRWFTIINIVDPHINEAPNIFYKEILPWINKIPKQTPEFSKIFAKKISTFIIDVGTTIERHTRTDLISAVCNNRVLHSFPPQQTWSRLIQITKSVISMSMDLFVELFRKFEKLYPINLRLTNNYSDGQLKDELAKTYKKSAVRVRIIRYLIFVVSRFMIDPIANREQRDYSMSIIIQYLNTHFFQDLSFEMNEILFKNCPISVESYNEIIMLPSRICDESFEVTNQINNKYYQPIVEPHSQKMLEAAVNNICKINSIIKHLEKSFYLKGFIKTGIFLKDLMKMYKHFCQYSTSNSALFIESSSSLITGLDWGIFLSELIEAIHIPFVTSDKNAINDFYKSLNLAMIKAADENQKVVFHLDSSVSCFKSELITTLMNLLQQDSITTIFQIFRKYFDNDQSVIKLKSNENARQSRASLENIKKNLKILITVNRIDLDINYNIKVLSDWFMMKSHKYIVLEAHNVEMYRESLDNMISVRLQSFSKHYRYLADAHLYFEQYFTRFHMKSQVNGHHLQLAASLYNYLYDIFYNKRHSKICQFELAIKSVTNAEQQIEKLKAKIDVLETNLQSLNEEINVSSSQVKNMKENYGLALNQCRKQENLIADLTGPLNELKEKSKSNLNEVSPTYMAALETIRNLDPGAVEEIKTYIKPPQIVRDLVEIIFYLLGYETNWEEIKEIMVRINLYEDLLYFDKDHIDDKRYSFLLKKLSDRNLDSEALVNISRAAASLSGWLHAILKYSSLSREINPQLGQLLSVQDKVNIAQSELGKMKVRTDMMRQDLEAKLNEHKELLSRKKVLVDHIRDIKYKINSGKNLLSDIRVYCDDWNNQLSELQQSLQNLPNEIIVFIIFNIYLSCIPFSLRQNIFNEFQQLYEIDIKKSDQLELFEENELRNLVDYHQWSSLMKLHIDNASFIASILCCPYISFLEFGSIILIHCHNNGVDNFAEILNSILKSDTVTTMHSNAFGLEHNESIEIIDYIDCAFNDHEAVDKKLEHYITMNIILLIDNIELLSELGPCFQFILYGSITKICFDVHPGFRLVLLTREMYSSTDTLDGYFSSSKLLHYELSLSSKDVQDFIHTLCVKICQPKLFERFQRLNKQIYETNHLSQLEKNVILNLAVECMSKSVQMEFPTIDQEAASIDMQPSILNIRNFHSTILSTDSKLLDFDSTNSAMKKKHKSIIESNEKFYYISEPVCLLLKTFEMFPFEIEIHKKIANKYTFSLNEIIDEMKLQIEKEVSSITVHETVDAEISDEFLQKLYKSTLATIIIGFDAKLDSQKLIEYTVKFCIDTITIDAENNEILSENEKNFIKYALLCQDFEQLLVENSQNSLDFIHDHTNKKISKDTLHLSLVVETNLASLHGLSKSIVDNEELWKEYFKFPFLKSTRMPGFSIGSQPELLQKSIVWRLLNPIKTKEIYSSIIAHVFGEDILSVSINRIETLRNYITKCSPLKPLLIFTPGNTIDCTDNPLEILENHHRIVGNSTKSVIINCASESDKFVDNFSSIYHLVTEPTWIILLNAHLFTNECGLLNFYNEIMKKLWRKFSNQLKNAIHPQCKMFVIFEKSNNLNLSGILSESTYLFICRPSVSFSGCDIVHGEDQKLEKQISLKAVDNIYRGLIKTEFFRQMIFGNNLDIKIVETICSNINPSFEQIRYIFKLIFDNKILSDNNGRKVFNDILLNLSEPIKEFLNGTLSDIAIARIIDDHKNNQCLSVFSQNCEASSALKLIDGDVIIDQHLIESTKSRLTDVYQQLNEIINIDLLGEFSVNQFYIKKLSTSIFHMILNLPIWFVRSMSNTRFDSRISSSDINTIKYQYFISNSKLPIKLSNDNINNLSEWLDSIEQIVIDLKKLIMTYDDQLMKTVITKITKNLNTE